MYHYQDKLAMCDLFWKHDAERDLFWNYDWNGDSDEDKVMMWGNRHYLEVFFDSELPRREFIEQAQG